MQTPKWRRRCRRLEAEGRMPMTIWERIGIAKKIADARIRVQPNIEERPQLEVEAILARDGGRAQGSIAAPMLDALYAFRPVVCAL